MSWFSFFLPLHLFSCMLQVTFIARALEPCYVYRVYEVYEPTFIFYCTNNRILPLIYMDGVCITIDIQHTFLYFIEQHISYMQNSSVRCDAEINEESQTSGITSSSSSSRVSTFVPEPSTSCSTSTRKRHADDFTTPQKT